MYEAWQPQSSDTSAIALMKKKFLMAHTNKFWNSLNMLHFVATFVDPSLRGFLFVRKAADSQGYFKKIQSLAQESQGSATPHQQTDGPEVCTAPPVKKMKTGSFNWFRTTCSEADG